MLANEKQLAERTNTELLQQIEKSLAHSRDVIAQINELLALRHAKQQPCRVFHE